MIIKIQDWTMKNINMDIEMGVYYDSDGLYEIIFQTLAFSHFIRNVDLS